MKIFWERLCLWQEQGRGAGAARGCVSSCRTLAAGCARCARLLLSVDFSLPSAQCCSKGVRTRSELCVLPRPPWCSLGDVVVTAQPRLSPPVSPRRGEELCGTRGDRNALLWRHGASEDCLKAPPWPGGLFISPQQFARKLLQTAAGSHPFFLLTTE